jgi:hypothetical protein
MLALYFALLVAVTHEFMFLPEFGVDLEMRIP